MSPDPITANAIIHTEEFPVSEHDQLDSPSRDSDWLWHGYLAPGRLTLLSSQWKCGKTTLLAAILMQMRAGGALLGLKVRPGRAVVVTEESLQTWHERSEKFPFSANVGWISRPFAAQPKRDDLRRLLDRVAGLAHERGLDLVVFDPLIEFLPGAQEDTPSVREALLALRRLTESGLAVLVLHHTRKNAAKDGQAARGSGALGGIADILIEMSWFGRASGTDRRRILQAWSRSRVTPRQLVFELNRDGTEFRGLGDLDEEAYGRQWRVLETVLADAPHKLTREAILDRWPENEAKPDPSTLWQWLTQAVATGKILRDATGKRNDPHRYWLQVNEKKFLATGGLEELPPLRDLI